MKLALYNRQEKGLKASAVVINDDQARFIIQNQISRVYDEVGIQYAYINCATEATRWVNEKLT